MTIRRGDIWLANLEPVVGSEANKAERPVVIVSRDSFNATVSRLNTGVVTVVPLTKTVDRAREFQPIIEPEPHNGLTHRSKAQAEQIRSIDVSRLVRRIGYLDAEKLTEVSDALALHLALEWF